VDPRIFFHGPFVILAKAMKKANSTHPWKRLPVAVVAVVACALAAAAQAQLRVPSISVPALPRVPLAPAVQQTVQQVVPLQDLRLTTTRDLIRRFPQAIEADPAGEPIRRAELLWLSPSAAAVDAARAQGFAVLREENLAELDLRQLVLRPPATVDTAQAAATLRTLDPQATVDFNHLYTRSGDVTGGAAGTATMPAALSAARIGLIDGGIARAHPALRHALVIGWGCAGKEVASDHGTAVASLMVGHEREFRGVQSAATLYAADVYCDQPTGGAAEDVARALAWMVRERVPVINISLVGPANRLVERATRAIIRQGHIVVAAVGNDGPAAPPLYPASYPGVVGVTGVNPARRALPEAAQGPQVMFAGPGSEIAIATPGGGYATGRGTSFAAPFVAGLLAESLREPNREAAAAAVAQLAAAALDLGAPGRDAIYGFGLVGEQAVTRSPGRSR
jgi:subtilisin family serine protease